MKRLTPCGLVTTAVLLMLGGGRLQADVINFQYKWSVLPSSVIANGTGSASFAVLDGTTNAERGVTTAIDAATVTTSSSASGTADTFNAPFSLKVDLTDTASGKSGNLSFSGSLTGLLDATSSTLTSTFSEPVTQWLDLGTNRYTVTIDPVEASLPAPGAQVSTLLDGLITVTDAPQPTTEPPQGGNAPEPSSLMLGGTALAMLLVRRWRRK